MAYLTLKRKQYQKKSLKTVHDDAALPPNNRNDRPSSSRVGLAESKKKKKQTYNISKNN